MRDVIANDEVKKPQAEAIIAEFVHDLFFFAHKCELYNYADDNTLSKSEKSLEKVIASLEEDSKALINCFSSLFFGILFSTEVPGKRTVTKI
jgi:G:T-mismatch repair DNA endonuclease (very short patch repair protein)